MEKLDKLHPLEKRNNEALLGIQKCRKKMKTIKKSYMMTTSKIALKKTKYNNLKKGIYFLKELLFKNYNQVKNLKLKNCSYIQFYKDNLSLQNKLLKLTDEYPNVKIIDILVDKLKHKNNKFTYVFKSDIRNIFEKKKINYYELYCLYAITNQSGISNESISVFVQEALRHFKKKTKKIILSTFFLYSDEQRHSNLEMIKKIREITTIKFEENKFTECFKQTLIYLKNLSEIYLFYCANKERYYILNYII